jgi:hypothetical protein
LSYRKYKDFHRIENGIEQKQCQDCNNWFDMNSENFNTVNANKDKFNHRCKKCQEIYQHNSYMKNREKEIASAKEWRKNNLEKCRASERKREGTPERIKYHREKSVYKRLKGNYKDWARRNPDKMKEYAKNHRKHDISDKEWEDCLRVFNYCCAYCGISQVEAKKRDKQRLHKEHVEHNGYNDLRNGVPACRSCNDKKWAFDMEEWYRQQEFFTEERLEFIKWWCSEGYKDYIEDKPPYRITRRRIHNEDGSYNIQHELWSTDEQRNMVACLATAKTKKDLNVFIDKLFPKTIPIDKLQTCGKIKI